MSDDRGTETQPALNLGHRAIFRRPQPVQKMTNPIDSYQCALGTEFNDHGLRPVEAIAYNAARRSRLKPADLRAVAACFRLTFAPLKAAKTPPTAAWNKFARDNTKLIVMGIEQYITSPDALRRKIKRAIAIIFLVFLGIFLWKQ